MQPCLLELFCEVSNGIRDRSPFPQTCYFGYANGWLGYLPSAAESGRGGYEPMVSPFTAAAADDLARAVTAHLAEAARRRVRGSRGGRDDSVSECALRGSRFGAQLV